MTASTEKQQHEKISGYRTLSEEEIQLINELKAKGNELGELIDRLQSTPSLDQRWVAVGKTDVQKGFMSLIRSVSQPTTFC